MEGEQAKTIEALQFAIKMEIDGKDYYHKASQQSPNKAGKELFQWLTGEEDKHRQRFEEIYSVIKANKAWPEGEINPAKRANLHTLFSAGDEKPDTKGEATRAELDAIAKAMEMENKTHDFYSAQSEKTTYDAEKNFYGALAAEERGHYLALVDYREYLVDPAGWFRTAEHHSLDGG